MTLDIDFWISVLRHGDLYFINDPLASFRVHKNSYSIQKQANKEHIKQYRQANRERTKQWHQANKEKRNKQDRKRRANDPVFRMIGSLRSGLSRAMNGTSKHAPTLELLGCTPEHFRFHLEQQFTDGMTWSNYGEWHMDHIIPCASFDQKDPEQQRICWHYTNYQPLWAEDNLRKSDTIIGEHQVKLL